MILVFKRWGTWHNQVWWINKEFSGFCSLIWRLPLVKFCTTWNLGRVFQGNMVRVFPQVLLHLSILLFSSVLISIFSYLLSFFFFFFFVLLSLCLLVALQIFSHENSLQAIKIHQESLLIESWFLKLHIPNFLFNFPPKTLSFLQSNWIGYLTIPSILIPYIKS